MSSLVIQAPATGREVPDRDKLLRPIPVPGIKSISLIAILAALLAWGMSSTGANFRTLAEGIPNIWTFVTRLVPFQFVIVNWELPLPGVSTTVRVPEAIPALVETVQMAIVGTFGAVLLLLPFGLLAARNISPHPAVYTSTRFLLNTNRAVPDIIFALILVAAVGLGPFAGILALMIGSIGTASKMYAGSHPTTGLAIANAQVDAGATTESTVRNMWLENTTDICYWEDGQTNRVRSQEDFDALYESCPDGHMVPIFYSDPIPSTPFAINKNLPPSFKHAVKDALLSTPQNPEFIQETGRWFPMRLTFCLKGRAR